MTAPDNFGSVSLTIPVMGVLNVGFRKAAPPLRDVDFLEKRVRQLEAENNRLRARLAREIEDRT